MDSNTEYRFWVDLRRPDLFDDASIAFWQQVHIRIKACNDRVKVNQMFSYIDDLLKSDGRYMGNGMSYKFWFTSEQDRAVFMQSLREIVAPHIIDGLEIGQ